LLFECIGPTKSTVLNTYEYSRHVLVQVYSTICREHNMPSLKAVDTNKLLFTRFHCL